MFNNVLFFYISSVSIVIILIFIIVFFTPYSIAMIIVGNLNQIFSIYYNFLIISKCLGSINLNNCPIQNKIPIWLIVSGSINLTGVLIISVFILVYGL